MHSDRNQQQGQRATERVFCSLGFLDKKVDTCVERKIIRRQTRDDTVPRCRAPKTLAHHLLLTPMASINILELGSQEEAAITVLCILSPSPDLLSACPYLAGCTLCVEFESVLSGMVDTGIIFFWPNTYPSANLGVLWIMGGVRCHHL